MLYELHPLFVHFPIALSIILPFFIASLLITTKNNNITNSIWTPVVIIAIFILISTIGTLITGSNGAEILKKSTISTALEKHEEIAEITAMLLFVTSLLSLVVLIFSPEKKRSLIKIILYLSLLQALLVFKSGKTGGELVHESDAPSIFKNMKQ